MIPHQTVLSVALACSAVALLALGLVHLRSTVGSVPAPPSTAPGAASEHYYCLDCYDDFGDRSAAVDHAKGLDGHEVTLLRRPSD